MQERSRRRNWCKYLCKLVALVLFISGCSIWVYPYANGNWTDYILHREAEEFLTFVHVDPQSSGQNVQQPGISSTTPMEPEETLPEQYPQLWQEMKAYNQSIFENKQEALSDSEAYEQPSFLLEDFGLESEVFAVLAIPALDLKMPVFLGATYQHMADGAAHMSQTSLPIGGDNTNCVIAGHRGWRGAAYFLYITDLKKGDIVTVTNLWEVLTYQVVEMKIISPYDVEAIHIQPGRELLTLLTCHPPATGGRERYLVFCERIETELEVSNYEEE